MKTVVNLGLDGVSQLLNRSIHANPTAIAALGSLAGKSILIEVTDFNLPLQIIFHADAIYLYHAKDDEANVSLRGTSRQLLRFAKNHDAKGLDVSGDAGVLQDLDGLQKRLSVDWEALLAEMVGDGASYTLFSAGRRFTDWLQDRFRLFGETVTDYVQQEVSLSPPVVAVEDYFEKVYQTYCATERLAARVARVQLLLEER